MQQVEIYLAGERDYSKIYGDTGPLVYPAMHVYIYRWLYEFTQGGTNIVLAQIWFCFLYIFNLGMVMACYRQAKVRRIRGSFEEERTTYSTVRTPLLTLNTGTTIHLSPTHLVKAIAQYLHTKVFQRWMGDGYAFRSNLPLSKQALELWCPGVLIGSWGQDELATCLASHRHPTVPS